MVCSEIISPSNAKSFQVKMLDNGADGPQCIVFHPGISYDIDRVGQFAGQLNIVRAEYNRVQIVTHFNEFKRLPGTHNIPDVKARKGLIQNQVMT